MLKQTLIFIALALFSLPAVAVTTPTSFHFQATPANSSLVCNATTTTSYEQFSGTQGAGQPDVVVRNIGTTPVYYEIGAGGASVTATVPTSSTYGSQVINPGEADLMSKANADTIACITSTSTGTLVITPGVGN